MEEVPCRTSVAALASLCFRLCLIGVETEGLLDYQWRVGIISVVRWNLHPVICGVDDLVVTLLLCLKLSSGGGVVENTPCFMGGTLRGSLTQPQCFRNRVLSRADGYYSPPTMVGERE